MAETMEDEMPSYQDLANAYTEGFIEGKNTQKENDRSALVLKPLSDHKIRAIKTIRDFSTWPDLTMVIANRPQKFLNTNRLVRSGDMDIGLQKTGFINAAGRCLVMQARINNTPLLLVFLDSVGTQSRFADAVRVRDWYERMPSGAQPIRRLM